MVFSSGVNSRGAPSVRRVSENISVSLFTSCVIWPVWGYLSAMARFSDGSAASFSVCFMFFLYEASVGF